MNERYSQSPDPPRRRRIRRRFHFTRSSPCTSCALSDFTAVPDRHQRGRRPHNNVQGKGLRRCQRPKAQGVLGLRVSYRAVGVSQALYDDDK